MSKTTIVYQCPVCEDHYETQDAALDCVRSHEPDETITEGYACNECWTFYVRKNDAERCCSNQEDLV